MGSIKDDGLGHYNPDPSEDPWGGGLITLPGGVQSSLRPDTVRDNRVDPEVHEGRMQTGRRRRMPGAGLNQRCAGRCCPTCRPSSRIGENPPYGMIGGIEETSASFEARSAPRSYPTCWLCRFMALGWHNRPARLVSAKADQKCSP